MSRLGNQLSYIHFAVGSVIAVDDSKFGESSKKYAPNMENVDMFCKYTLANSYQLMIKVAY